MKPRQPAAWGRARHPRLQAAGCRLYAAGTAGGMRRGGGRGACLLMGRGRSSELGCLAEREGGKGGVGDTRGMCENSIIFTIFL